MKKISYDFVLTMSAVVLMFLLSLLCIGSMFYFKWAALQSVPVDVKIAFQEQMNRLAAPLIAGIVLILGICVPNRFLPTRWLNRVTGILGFAAATVWLIEGWRMALLFILGAAALLQLLTLLLALSGQKLNFRCEGYWAKIGSCLVHLGLILFCLCVLLLGLTGFSSGLFWTSSGLTMSGLVLLALAQSSSL